MPFNKAKVDIKKQLTTLTLNMSPTSAWAEPFYHDDNRSKNELAKITTDLFKAKYNSHLIISAHSNYGHNRQLASMVGGGF